MLGGRFAYFLIFFLLGGREGGVQGTRKEGGSIFIEKCQEGGFSQEKGGGGEGPEGCLRGIWGGGGGGEYFFSGPKFPPSHFGPFWSREC